MAKHLVKKGSTSRIEYVWISDSGSAVGGGKTALAFNTASLTAYYCRQAAAATAITLATQTVTGAFSSGGFVEVDATNMPGLYRFDPPDAAFATGVSKVTFLLKGAAGMAPVVLEYQLVDFDPESAADLGLTKFADIEADTQDIQSRLPAALVSGRIDASVGAMAASVLTASAIDADAITDAKVASDVTIASVTGAVGSVTGAVGSVTGLTASDVGAIKTKTDSLTFTVAGMVDSNVVDWKGATAPAMTGDAFARLGAPAGASISADLDNRFDSVDTELASLSSGLATAGALAVVAGNVIAIKAVTDKLDDTVELTSDGYVFTAPALEQVPTGSAAPTAIEIADAFLDRDMSTGADSGSPTVRTPRQALRALRNKWDNAAGTYTVYKENDSTVSWTSVIATDAAAVPVIGSDPA